MRSGLASLFLALCANSLLTAQTGSLRKVDFATEIHPLLESRCRGCHAGETAQAGFRVDDGAAFLKGGKSGPAVVPGEAAGPRASSGTCGTVAVSSSTAADTSAGAAFSDVPDGAACSRASSGT